MNGSCKLQMTAVGTFFKAISENLILYWTKKFLKPCLYATIKITCGLKMKRLLSIYRMKK